MAQNGLLVRSPLVRDICRYSLLADKFICDIKPVNIYQNAESIN